MDETGGHSGTSAALMDSVYRNQRHIYDLTRKYYLLGRDRLIARLVPPPGGSVLELGCGTGRNLIEAARLYPDARFYGLDISREMLATAEANIRRAGLEGRILLACGDASAFDSEALFGRASFDRVFMSYTLSMIPPWREAMAAGFMALSSGGLLSVVDFGQQERLPGLFRRLLHAWLAKFHVTPRADMLDAAQLLAARHEARCEAGALYRGYAVWAEITRV
jgi:S-adenosylmethionine-diacylgycerolhomoserine-N-methlytransferase